MGPSSICKVRRAEIATGFVLATIVAVSSGACAAKAPQLSTAPRIAHHATTAGVLPGSWQRVESLKRASPIIVTVRNGERLEGAFKAVAPGDLTLTDSSGREFSVPKREIDTIVSTAQGHGGNAARIGAGAGFIAGLAVLAIGGSREAPVRPSNEEPPLVLSALGSRVGVLVDRSDKRHRLIYLAAR